MATLDRNRVDPDYSANLYGSGLLDRIVLELVEPFRRSLLEIDSEARIWAIRYSRRGEHLKLRVHTSIEAQQVDSELRGLAEPWFARQDEATGERVARFDVPSIDREDDGDLAATDRSVLVTRYERSEVTLGSSELFDNDEIIGAMYVALSRGFERCLGLTGTDPLAAQRLPLALATFVDGVSATLPRDGVASSSELREKNSRMAAYLAYHRDWLLRFFIGTTAREAELRAHFDERAGEMAPHLDLASNSSDAADDGWTLAMTTLSGALDSLPADLDLDPFAATPRDPVLFKVLHGVANSFGVHPMNEAFACHLAACVLDPAASVPSSPRSSEVSA